MNCESISDLLPDLASAALDDATSASLHAHITVCDECAAEWRIVQSVRADAMAVPADLEAGIAAAVSRMPHRRRSHMPYYAAAAAVAFALFGGILTVQRLGDPASIARTVESMPAAAGGEAAFPVVTDPLVGNQSAVSELTAEQLEALLTEMDS
jgi:hypothetical protein